MKKVVKILSIFIIMTLLTACAGTKKVDINKTRVVALDSLSVEIPTAFEKTTESSETMYFFDAEDYDYDLSVCSLTLSVSKLYGTYSGTIEETIENDFPSKFFQPFEIKKTIVNGAEWTIGEAKSIEKDGGHYLKGLYISDYNNQRYTFEYTNYLAEKVSCDKMIQKIAKSLKFQ